jgi:tetratricopeptide (TPR) repeat protein/Fe-S-cluster-containing hydrogenase component 2
MDRMSAEATARRADPSKYSRRRVAVLILVHIAVGLHIMHWMRTGRTVAPMELNEVVYTFTVGIVTAGFLLLALAFVASAIFGRFFCSWACHILALQDLFRWTLAKFGITLRPMRSRVLRWVPIVAALYMFVAPLAWRMIQENSLPTFHLRSDAQGWASLVTSDFWRNLPGGWITLSTFAVCGGVIVYALGSRGFCSSVCPYGALFGFADRISPGRLVSRGDCAGCAKCTAACSSHIRVHEELARFGTIVDKGCLRDLDCMAACPNGNIAFGFTKPPILRGGGAWSGLPRKFDLTAAEELVLLAACAAAFFALRGLYDSLPFLLSIALAVVIAAMLVLWMRVLRRRDAKLQKLVLVREGRVSRAGAAFTCFGALLCLLVAHSGWMRWNERAAQRALDVAESEPEPGGARREALAQAREHVEIVQRFGLFDSRLARLRRARVAELSGDLETAERTLAALEEQKPNDRLVVLPLARVCNELGQHARAGELLDRGLAAVPEIQRDRRDVVTYLTEVHTLRGEIAGEAGDLDLARTHLEQACELSPSSALAHYQLGVLMMAQHRADDARAQFVRAVELAPNDVDARNNLGFVLLEQQRAAEAEVHLRRAVELAPDYAAARFNLGRALLARGATEEAAQHLAIARKLEPRYADAVDELLGAGR